MIELNEKDFCIEIREQLSWDPTVKYILDEIKEELTDWYENNLDDMEETGLAYDATYEDMDNCKKFLDSLNGTKNDWPRELKIEALKNIIEHWNNVSYGDDCEVSILDADIIREGIYQTIEEEFNFDGRMG